MSSVHQYNRTGTSWPSHLEQVPDLYSDAQANVIESSIYERVYAWVHMARDYGVLYNNGRPFVVTLPLLSVDPLAIAIILVSYPCLPAFSQLLPTKRLYVDLDPCLPPLNSFCQINYQRYITTRRFTGGESFPFCQDIHHHSST